MNKDSFKVKILVERPMRRSRRTHDKPVSYIEDDNNVDHMYDWVPRKRFQHLFVGDNVRILEQFDIIINIDKSSRHYRYSIRFNDGKTVENVCRGDIILVSSRTASSTTPVSIMISNIVLIIDTLMLFSLMISQNWMQIN